VNQDTCVSKLFEANGHQVAVAAVFDGHGLLGELASEVACRVLESKCSDVDDRGSWAHAFTEDAEGTMRGLFHELQEAVLEAHQVPRSAYSYTSGSTTLDFVLKEGQGPAELGAMYVSEEHPYQPPRPIDFGCTAVIAVCVGDRIVVGNAGDAGALYLEKDKPGYEDRDGYCVTTLTRKHTAKEAAEVERVERDFPGLALITPDGYLASTDAFLGQYEVELTRSLGHNLLRRAGLISEPEVRVVAISDVHSFGLVLCSDGVTDELDGPGILDRVAQAGSAREASQVLCKEAQDYCMDESKIDDCTAVVVLFKA
jgi:serine/threonine protein phosphatase PrpC